VVSVISPWHSALRDHAKSQQSGVVSGPCLTVLLRLMSNRARP
jgi:hypothetical protein